MKVMRGVLSSGNGRSSIFMSERCYARLFDDGDIDDFMIYRNNQDWMAYQGFKCMTRQEYEKALLKKPSLDEGVQLAVIRKSDTKLIGDLYIKRDKKDYWIGYTVNPAYKRNGYASEIVTAMLGWLIGQDAARIMAEVDADNIPSIRFLVKNGFVKMKTDRDAVIYGWNLSR